MSEQKGWYKFTDKENQLILAECSSISVINNESISEAVRRLLAKYPEGFRKRTYGSLRKQAHLLLHGEAKHVASSSSRVNLPEEEVDYYSSRSTPVAPKDLRRSLVARPSFFSDRDTFEKRLIGGR